MSSRGPVGQVERVIRGLGHKIGYARVSSADQNRRLQIDALRGEDCLKAYIYTATATRTNRPQWLACQSDHVPAR